MRVLRTLPAAVAMLLLSSSLYAQGHGMMGGHTMGAGQKPKQEDKKDGCKAFMDKQKEMKSRLEAMDAELNKKVETMHAAKEGEKAEAMAAVLDGLVSQRQAMREQMMDGMLRMMSHMTEHVGTGATQTAMSDCPMMREMGGEHGGSEASGGGHSQH